MIHLEPKINVKGWTKDKDEVKVLFCLVFIDTLRRGPCN